MCQARPVVLLRRASSRHGTILKLLVAVEPRVHSLSRYHAPSRRSCGHPTHSLASLKQTSKTRSSISSLDKAHLRPARLHLLVNTIDHRQRRAMLVMRVPGSESQ